MHVRNHSVLKAAVALLAMCAVSAMFAQLAAAQFPQATAPEPTSQSQWESIGQAIRRIPLAAALGAILAFRPRRKGTPARTAAVVQTQIILAIVGAVVMLVVGSSVARAFGIVGAASLVRYRAKIDDPKDAGIMLSTLGVGLASGVGLYALAVFSTIFVAVVVGVLESTEPEVYKLFDLKIKAKDAPAIRPRVQLILRRNKIRYELRSSGDEEIVYETRVPAHRKTDGITEAIHAIDATNEVEWEEKKAMKPT
ncbi:MAG TPA: hypothetical protein VFZ73_02870 [Gemmatimonadaceae bacterium]